MQQWGRALSQAEARFGVDRYVIAGVWGVESDFGKNFGDRPLVQSLATLSCYAPRRQAYFAGELMATLKIVQDGDIDPRLLKGSWAGAFGHTQFMPSTFQRLAVDGDGDGRRDVVSSVAGCNGLDGELPKKAGWVNGLPWGYEVRLPSNFSPSARGPQEETRPRFLGRHGRHPGRWATVVGRLRSGRVDTGGNQRAGFHRHPELRCGLFLQRRRILWPRHRAAGRSAQRSSGHSHRLAHGRSAAFACASARNCRSS